MLSPRQVILLLFMEDNNGGELDPIRIQKGLFVLSKEVPKEWIPAEARHNFVPYLYGPYSFDINSDLKMLVKEGFIKARNKPDVSWKYYSLTEKGKGLVKEKSESMMLELVSYIKTIREFVGELPFDLLLKVVYKKYPEYAAKSVFKF